MKDSGYLTSGTIVVSPFVMFHTFCRHVIHIEVLKLVKNGWKDRHCFIVVEGKNNLQAHCTLPSKQEAMVKYS